MKDGDGPDFDGSDPATLNRRRVLQAIGGTTVGLLAVSGTASAHQIKFYGCSQLCTDTQGNMAVVATGGGYESRPIERTSDRNDVPWDWESYCYEAADDEAIVGMLEEEIWQGSTKHEDGECKLCVNPNNCATNYYDDVSEIVDALNESETSGVCRGNVVVGDCETFGTGDGENGGQVTKLTAADAGAEALFGWSVALNDAGDRIIVGAPKTEFLYRDATDTGAAYVFDYDGAKWNQRATLTSSDGIAGDAFGWDVAFDESGETALVGAPGSGSNDDEPGTAYAFEFDGTDWTETAKLTSANGSATDAFGSAVALDDDGDTVLIGAQGEDPRAGPSGGAAYAFQVQSGTWTQVERLLLNRGDDDAVGWSVDLDAAGDDGIVGGPGVGPDDEGSASLVSNGTNWTDTERFQPDTLEWLDRFGSDVNLDDPASVAVIGARQDHVGGTEDQGSAFVFADDDGWGQQAHLTANDGGADDEYGTSVDVDADGDLTLIGAPGASGTTSGSDTGAAYAYTFDGSSWTDETKLTPDDGADGDDYGRAVALDDTRQIAVVGAPGNDETAIDAGAVYVHSL